MLLTADARVKAIAEEQWRITHRLEADLQTPNLSAGMASPSLHQDSTCRRPKNRSAFFMAVVVVLIELRDRCESGIGASCRQC